MANWAVTVFYQKANFKRPPKQTAALFTLKTCKGFLVNVFELFTLKHIVYNRHVSASSEKYIWDSWKNKTPLEEPAIKAVFRAREIVLEKILKENIFAMYFGGTLIRR